MRRLLLTALIGAAVLSGCGDDGADGVTKQEYVAKADAICKDANAKERALGAEGAGWIYSEQFDDPEFLSDFTDIGRVTVGRLEALAAPQEDPKAAAEVVAAIGHMVRALDERTAALRAGKDTRRGEQVHAYELGFSDLVSAAGRLGLTQCQGILL